MTLSFLATATLVSGFLIGLVPTLIDSLKKPWQARLNQPAERLEWAVRLFYFCWLPAMPLTGWLLDQIHHERIFLFFGLLALILGLAWLAMVRSFSLLLANMVLVGCAYSVMTTCGVLLMTTVLFPEAGKFNLASLNLGFIPVAIGALLGPGIVSLIDRWWGYRQGILYLSLACIVPAALIAMSGSDSAAPSLLIDDVSPNATPLLHLATIAGIILFYFAIENCLEFWPEPYLKELGYANRALQGGMLVFWLAFVATRAAAAWWFYEHPGHLHPAQGIVVTLVLVILSAMVMGNLAGGYEVGSGSLGFWLAGACYGPVLPCLLGIFLNWFPGHSSALGLLLSLSGLDTLIVRPLMCTYAANRPARTVMRVPIILALVLAAPLLVLAFAQI